MKSYKNKFFDNLDAEIADFRNRTLRQSPKEMYDDASNIYFYEYMNEYLRLKNFKTEKYKMFLESGQNFIYNLWCEALKMDEFIAGSSAKASVLVDIYIRTLPQYM